MRSFSLIAFEPLGYVLSTALLVTSLFLFYACVRAFSRRGRGAYKAFTAAQFAAAATVFLLLSDGGYRPVHLPERTSFPAAVTAVCSLPWAVIAAFCAVSAAVAAVLMATDARLLRGRPSFGSIKEALDDLPVGICFTQSDGTVDLANLKMNEWCRAITGQPLSDGAALIKAVRENGEKSGQSVLQRAPDGAALLFALDDLTVGGKKYTQLTATDVTESYRVTAELESHNAKLREISERMKAYSRDLTELVMSEENLRARVAVHDELGHALLLSKHHLDYPSGSDRSALYELLRRTNSFLLDADRPEPTAGSDPFAEAMDLARGIGVAVEVGGEPPEEGTALILAAQAARECAVNAVKHADGDRMRIAFTRDGGSLKMSFASNGRPARDKVVPTGGLRSLASGVAAAGGSLSISAAPEFTVTIVLPSRDERP